MNSQHTTHYIEAEGQLSFAWMVESDSEELSDTVIDFLAWHGELYGILEGNALFFEEDK